MKTPVPSADFYDLDSALSPEQREMRALIRDFLEREVLPIITDYWERGEFPVHLVPRFGWLAQQTIGRGGYAFPHPEPLTLGILKLELGRADPSLTSFFSVHWGLAMGSIHLFGTDEQRARWIPGMSTLETLGSWALTEPLIGSAAAQGLMTTAQQDGDHWVLNGAKKWNGNATTADLTVVMARDLADQQVKAFVIERGTPGYQVKDLKGKLAKRALSNGDVTLTDCRVPEANRLPGVRGFRDIASQLAIGRSMVAWEACGIAQGAYELALDYTRERRQFGRPIAGFQLVQDKLVRMLSNVVTMQTLLLRLSELEGSGRGTSERSSLAKLICGARMRETVALAREVMGGNGILLENRVAKLFADAEAVYTYEGTQEINTLIVGRAITGIGAFV